MTYFVWIAMTVLTLHVANSYVLLTANLEDVAAIAKQLSNSPLSEQLDKIWRRAAQQFNMHKNKDTAEQEFVQRAQYYVDARKHYEQQKQGPPPQSFHPEHPIVETYRRNEPLPEDFNENQNQVQNEVERIRALEKIRTEDMVGYHGVGHNGDSSVYLKPKSLR